MNYQHHLLSPSISIVRHISQIQYQRYKQISHVDRHHRLSQPRASKNIKINKNKLPGDFFQKRQIRKGSQHKNFFPQQLTEHVLHFKKYQSQRMNFSPQKTSLLGFMEDKSSESSFKINNPSFFINRKFETRQEPKRDIFGVEGYRKVTNTSKPAKRNLLDLFPSTYDQKMTDFINDSTKIHLVRTNPTRQLTPIQRQSYFLVDPQKANQVDEYKSNIATRRMKDNSNKIANIGQNNNPNQMNITFYNSKSNYLPPINRQNP